jgi:tetratricopeptide (TPR) repeat protein
MIARDEERLLPACLESVRGVVDEIVLVDTGSTDRTRELAQAAGARVLEHPWNDDFAAPRNEAVRHARGEWILQLDADERLGPGASAVIRRALPRARFDAAMLPLHDAATLEAPAVDVVAGRARIGNPMWLPRLLRNEGGLEYRGIIHESVEEWFLRRKGEATFLAAPIVHLGAVPSLRSALGKKERNLALLRRRCEEVPDDVTALGYLAGELLEMGDAEGAASAVDAGWRVVRGQPSWRSVLRLVVARARLALRRGDSAGALEAVELGTSRQGDTLDFAFLRGCALDLASYRCEDPAARRQLAASAARAYGDALGLHRRPAVERLCGAALPEIHVRRAHALLVAGLPEDALSDLDAALAIEPTSALARVGRAEALLDRGDALAALRLLEPALAERPDAWLLASDAARAMGASREADMLLARARERFGVGFAAPHRELRFREATGRAPPRYAIAAAQQPVPSARHAGAPGLPAPPRLGRDRERYAVTVISPPGYVHAAAFREVAETLAYGLEALGHDVTLGTDPRAAGRRHIVLGANLLPHTNERLLEGSILYNLEQVAPDSPWLTPALLELYRTYPVWDYSALNADALVAMGLPRPQLVPIGWMPQLRRIPSLEEDIDVLFYGSMNERRAAVLHDLERRGARVHAAFGVYGDERDRLIARSRVVLNVHYYEAKVFEIVRVSYLLGNGRAVVSERGADPAQEAPFEQGVAFAPYEGLVDTCLRLLGEPETRQRLANAGQLVMSARLQVNYLEPVLTSFTRPGPPRV